MEFPDDVLVIIILLCRFPLKDLLRLKLVCKSWFRLISSDPLFSINYARNSPFTFIFRVTGDYRDPNMLSFSLIEFAGKGENTQLIPITTPKIPYHPGSNSRLSLIGSCDCSVFILHYKRRANHAVYRVYSFNPVLGSRVKLVAEDRMGKWEKREYKVGFIPSNNTYKILRFVPVSGSEKVEKAEIFTVGGLDDENWRNVDAANDPFGARLICFNGAYHWLSSSDHDRIFTFDLLEEKSGAGIPKPHGMSRRRLSSDNTSRLTIINNRLSVADVFFENYYFTMVTWTMGEYGVVDSWSKLFVLAPPTAYHDRLSFFHGDDVKSRFLGLLPIAVLANGDILFAEKSSNGMCFYNSHENRMKLINEPRELAPLYRRYENTYVPRFCR